MPAIQAVAGIHHSAFSSFRPVSGAHVGHDRPLPRTEWQSTGLAVALTGSRLAGSGGRIRLGACA